MPVEPQPCAPGGGGGTDEGCCSPSITSQPLCRADGTPILLVVRSGCACGSTPAGDPETAGWIDPATGTFTPGPAPAGAGPCDGECLDVTTVQLCDLTPGGGCVPFLRHLVRDCDGAITSTTDTTLDGTTAYTVAGAAGDCSACAVECVDTICVQRCDDTDGDGQADQTYSELWCVHVDGSTELVLTYADDPSQPYTPVAPVECTYGCPESQTVLLCDDSGAFLRRYTFLNGTASFEDVALDGHTPHIVTGTVGVCASDNDCLDTVCRTRCDDTDGDGQADATYSELWCVHADGSADLVLTYQDDPSVAYTPVAPVECEYGAVASEALTLCDDSGPFLRRYTWLNGAASYEDVALDGQTPHVVTGTVRTCTAETPCEAQTTPAATLGLCLADGTPIAVIVTRDCNGTVTRDGWLNLTTGAYSQGELPAGTMACGDSRSITVAGTFCDVDPGTGDVHGLVLVEYSYAADGSIASVRLVDAVTGTTYTPQGDVTTCPAGVEQPERDLVQLCDTAAGGAVTQFVRDYARDENGQITGHTDYLLDGTPYTAAGTVGVCPTESACRNCTTHVLCDTDASPPATIAGTAAAGTLPNGVTWTSTGPSAFPPSTQGDGAAWWGVALFPNPVVPLTTYTFNQPVTAEFSVVMVYVAGTAPGQNTVQLPVGAVPLSLPPGYTYNWATGILSADATLTGCAPLQTPTRATSARFRITGVSSFALRYLGPRALLADCRRLGNWVFGAVDVSLGGEFLRTVCRDCSGAVTSTTDTLLDGTTPYTPLGVVGVCHPAETEPCASTVQVLRLCDLNPTVEPDPESGKRCAVPFLRHLVHDCTGALTDTRDTEMDGITPYTPVKVADCGSGGVPALRELLWPQTGIAEDPAGTARQDFVYTVTNPETGEVARVKLHASSQAPGGCGTYDPANPIFNNPTTYTLTLDAAAQEMSTFRLDLVDFDTFEGITNLSPVPSRVEGDVTWNGSTITANRNDQPAYVYWDNPPAQISYRYGNTGGGLACSSVRFQGMTLIPDGCCGCGTEPCRDTSNALLCDTTTTEAVTVFDPVNRTGPDGWQVVSYTGAQPGYGPTGPMPYDVYRAANNHGQMSYGARPDLNIGPGPGWSSWETVPVRWVIRKEFTAPQDGTATLTATGFMADGAGRVRINGTDMGLYSQWGQPGVGGGGQAPVTAGPNVIEIEVRDDWGFNWATGRLDIVMTKTVQFLRRQVVDCETGEVVSVTDTTLDGQPYTVTGEVGQCEPTAECCPPETRFDVETEILCLVDEASSTVVGRVLAEWVYDDQSGARVQQRLVDLATGDPVEVTPGAVVTTCTEPCRDSSSTLLCDTAATDTITVFDPANRPNSDGWEVVSFTGAKPDAPPEAAMPYPARYGNVFGYPALGARADQSAGYGGSQWPGYDAAPVRWVLRKTFNAPQDGVAVAQSVGFRGDGGARVRINNVDAGMYGQWNQPATSGTAQIPVTAGPNVIEIEVRDVNGINNVTGRLDIALPRTVQFMRRQAVDCETGEVVSTQDYTLDGEPYTVVGAVGQCEPVAQCCEPPAPEARVDVETLLLCVRDTASGEVLDQVLVERVYDDQTGDRLEQRLTDPTTGDPVELPAGALLARCPSPDRITRQICIVETGATQFLTNAANATAGQDTDWRWAPNLAGTWYPMYQVAPNPLWTVTDTAPNQAHWVSPHQDKSVCSPNTATSPNVTGTWYTRASWNLPANVNPDTIRVAASVLNADNGVVQWRLNDGAWQPVGAGALNPPPWTFPPTAIPGGRAGQNEIIVQIIETQPAVNCPSPNQAGMLLHVAATYDYEPRVWTQVIEDGRVYYLDESGQRQEEIPAGQRVVPCGEGDGECCPWRDAESLLLCDTAPDGTSTEFVRAFVYNDADPATPTTIDTTLDGQPYTVTGEVTQCATDSECRDATSVLLCDLDPDCQAGGTPSIADEPNPSQFPNWGTGGWCLLQTPGQGAPVWAGGSVVLGPDVRCPKSGNGDTHRTIGARLTAGSPTATDPVSVTVKVRVTNQGPNPGFHGDGRFALWNTVTNTRLVWRDVAGSAPVGHQQTLTLTASVPAAELAAGNIAVILDLETFQDPGAKAWLVDEFEWSADVPVTECEKQFLRTIVKDCATGATVSVTDTTLDGEPYEVTGDVGQCTSAGGTKPCRNTSSLLVCDLPTDGQPDPTVTDTDPAPHYPYATGSAMPGGQTLWDGGTLTIPAGTAPQPGTTGSVRTLAATIQATRPACDTGTAHVTVSVNAAQLGLDTGCAITGVLALYNGAAASPLASAQPPSNTPVGWTGTLTVEADVPAADLAAGSLTVLLALDAYDDNPSVCSGSPRRTSWELSSFTAAVAFDQTGCATQILRNVTTDCATGEVVSVTDTTLDGQPYIVTGEVGQCEAAGGQCCPTEPCPAQNIIEACRCDDSDGDGIGDVDYVELLAVDCAGALTTLGTYTADLTGPYMPASPVECPVEGAPSAYGVQAHRVQLAPGGSWSAMSVPLLQSVTATAHGGTGQITTADGASTLFTGESVTWSVGRDDDAMLVGPLTITAQTGTVTISYTQGVLL
ncbi:hypothetical protein [Nonomuraea sp. NPDC052265]|uniref:hypothetical protein n=1 Tax=Nonomuraea sp. NPDC052265 TaxID=3364374 RepID=UPI0037C74436